MPPTPRRCWPGSCACRFRLRVAPRDAGDEFVVVGGVADAVTPWVGHTGVPLLWRDPWPQVAVGGWSYAVVDPHPGGDRSWTEGLVTPGGLDALLGGRDLRGGR